VSVYECKKTKRLFVQFQFEGKTYKKRLPEGTTRLQAAQLEVKLKNSLYFNRGVQTDKNEELWENFLMDTYLPHIEANQGPEALKRAIAVCKASMQFLKGMTVRSIKSADLERLKTDRMLTLSPHKKLRKPATIHREMSIISGAFTMAIANDLCEYNPCTRVSLPKFDNIQDRILPVEHWERFFKGFRNKLQREVCITVIFTGLRQNDVLGLRKDQVNWDTGQIVLIQGKVKRTVRIDMNETVRAILASRMDVPGQLFFPSYRKRGAKMGSIRNGIKYACIRAGIDPITIRDLRRTFGTHLHEMGFDDSTVASLLGHGDLRSVHRYKRGTAIKKSAVDALEKLAKSAYIPTAPKNPANDE
jgi:integrase